MQPENCGEAFALHDFQIKQHTETLQKLNDVPAALAALNESIARINQTMDRIDAKAQAQADGNAEWQDVVPTLDEVKLKKRQEINAAKDAEEAATPFMYMEKPFDFDPLSRERLNVAIQLAQSLKITNVLGNTVIANWKLYDNTMTELTIDALVLMPQAFAERSAFLHEKAWTLKEQVDAATTVEQVNEINWEA